jgi:hypothetical protein
MGYKVPRVDYRVIDMIHVDVYHPTEFGLLESI